MVSIIIPNFNHSKYLVERIESVLNQSFVDFECIILDDASTDSSREIIMFYKERDSRIKFFPSTTNSGSPFFQWNKGVKLAVYDLIWIAESDDRCKFNFLENSVKVHIENPEIAISFCQSSKINGDGIKMGSWKSYTDDLDDIQFSHDFIMDGEGFVEKFLIHRNVIPNASGVVFKKSAFEKSGGANEKLTTNSDWLTWLKMLINQKIFFISDELNEFRFHDQSVIAKHSNDSVNFYKEMYDFTLRIQFEKWCFINEIKLNKGILAINHLYISFERGNRGIYNYKNRKWVKGLKDIFMASLYPIPTLGYVKRILNQGKL